MDPQKTPAKTDKEKPRRFWGGLLGWDRATASQLKLQHSVQKSIKKRCGRRVDDLSVVTASDGTLRIEGEVANLLDRAFALKQLDQVTELRNEAYTAVFRVQNY